MSKKPQKFETLTIKYSAQPEHIAMIRKAAAGIKLETFFHMCVMDWLGTHYFPKRVLIDQALYQKLVAKAKELGIDPDEYATQLFKQQLES